MFDSRQRLVVLALILVSAILIGTIGWISTASVPLIAVTPCHSEFDAGRAIQYAGVLALNFQNRVTAATVRVGPQSICGRSSSPWVIEWKTRPSRCG